MRVQQREDIVDDLVLGFGEQVRLRKGRLRDVCLGILQAELGDDLVEVLLRAEALVCSITSCHRQLPTELG